MPNYNGRAVFVGNLPEVVREKDLEDIFYKFGKIVNIDVKRPPRPPFFAFVEFQEPRDAEDAARRRDGVELLGSRIRCEVAKGGDVRSNHRPVSARSTGYRVIIRNLPRTASWQDIKDHFRPYARPVFTEVQREKDRDGGLIGIAEFDSYEDMKNAIRKCDDTEFKNPFGKGVYIRVSEDRKDRDRGRDDRGRDDRGRDDRERDERERGRELGRERRSRSHERSRSPAKRPRDDDRSRSRSKSRSKSPAVKRERDDDRSKSRSKSPAAKRGRDGDRSKSRSKSPAKRSKSRSKSPAPAKRSRSPSKSKSPPGRKSVSPARSDKRGKSRSASPVKSE